MPAKEIADALPEKSLCYADVIVPRHIAQPFTYLVPRELADRLKIGHRVLVPFGRAALEAVVIALNRQRPAGLPPMPLKEIRALISPERESALFGPLFELSRKVSHEYIAPWGQCLRLVLPFSRKVGSATRCVATEQGHAALKTGQCPEQFRPMLQRIARRSTGVMSSTLLQSGGRGSTAILDALKSYSWITVAAVERDGGEVVLKKANAATKKLESRVARDQTGGHLPAVDPVLLGRVSAGIAGGQTKTIVVHGPWDHRLSVLAGAVQQAHAIGKSVIIISGEATRAAWLRQVLATMTDIPVTLFHAGQGAWSLTGLSGPESRESPTMVVGTRSAVFAPLQSIGLIWVDQEDNQALKELQEPRYHARDVACMRGAIEGALVVLASSHPSLESIEHPAVEVYAIQDGGSRRPAIDVVDLRGEAAGTLLSQTLVAAMREAVGQKAGVLLFLNRKGFAGALVCRDCGWVPRCAACAVALTYYREVAKLACRYCGMAEVLPETCPMCQASHLAPVGEGTERAELEARRLFPNASIARLDGDTLRRPTAARALWEGIQSGAFDIVVGTQVLFGREPLPLMGLVGILHADSGLHVPDFRAAERTYQLLVDAEEVARPSSAGGRVIVQTSMPAHHAIESFVSGLPRRFYDEELAARRLLGYPPARHLVSLSVSGIQVRLVQTAAQQWRRRVETAAGGADAVMMLGPVPSMAGRPKGHHRYHILAKGHDRELLLHAVRESVLAMEREYKRGQLKFVVDVDPVDMS